MTKEGIDNWAEQNGVDMDGALLADGFEDAFIGVGQICGEPPVAVYNREKCVEVLMARDGMDYEEAVEYLEFNTFGAYVGPQTPMFITLMSFDVEDDDDGEADKSA